MFASQFDPKTRRGQRGATMVSVSLLSIALVSASLLLVRQANRSASEAGVVVARERALMAAQAAGELATSYYRERVESDVQALDFVLAGTFPSGSPNTCLDIRRDCIPGSAQQNDVPTTGYRIRELTGRSDCAGRACMRPGAVAFLPDRSGTNPIPWVEVPLSVLVPNGDPEAFVTVWARNNAADALGDPANGKSGSWTDDEDQQVVVTAMAEVHGVRVAIEQEVALITSEGQKVWQMATPDLSYGGGHNNDNVSVETCAAGAAAQGGAVP